MNRYFLLVSISSLVMLSCQTNNLTVSYLDKSITNYSFNTLFLGPITFDSVYSYNDSLPSLVSVIKQSAIQNRFLVYSQNDLNNSDMENPIISFSFREKNYIKGYKNVLSISLIAEIMLPQENTPIIIVSNLHEGNDSFDSFIQMKKMIDQVFQSLDKHLSKIDQDRK